MIKKPFFPLFTLIIAALFFTKCGIFQPVKTDTPPHFDNRKAITIIKTARSYIGSPYLYGGVTARGFDCSGLVTVAFQSENLKLPRASYAMATVGREIKTQDVKIGDLIFFITNKSNTINHVGIVTERKQNGDVMFIHASDSGVREDNLAMKYYKNAFVKAMRPFN